MTCFILCLLWAVAHLSGTTHFSHGPKRVVYIFHIREVWVNGFTELYADNIKTECGAVCNISIFNLCDGITWM